jgi:uncharacterized protein
MSVLTCPVCQGSMREMNKSGVLIDTCTQCRGVWLDRGELEKLSNVMGQVPDPVQGGGLFSGSPIPPREDRRSYRRDDDDDDDDRRRNEGYGKKSKTSRFLDFFD